MYLKAIKREICDLDLVIDTIFLTYCVFYEAKQNVRITDINNSRLHSIRKVSFKFKQFT